MVFTAGGLLLGDGGLGLIDSDIDTETVRIVAEATLTLVLFSDAAGLDLGALRREYAVPVRLLAIGLPLTIAAGVAVGLGVLGGVTALEAVILAIILAPTDAALGQAVVTDARVPTRIRQGLNVESGLNDGICVPLLLIAIGVAEVEDGAIGSGHGVRLVAEEIGWGIVGGVAAGVLAALVLRLAPGWAPRGIWRAMVPLAGAGLSYGVAVALGGSGFIAAFVGGLVFGGLRPRRDAEVAAFLEDAGTLLTAVTFVLFGGAMLTPALGHVGWSELGYALLSLTVVRMLPVAVAMAGSGARRPTVAFMGWFGPRGLASIVFAALIVNEADLPHTGALLDVVFLTIGLSLLLHGLTAAPLTARYGRWFRSHPAHLAPPLESGGAPPPDR